MIIEIDDAELKYFARTYYQVQGRKFSKYYYWHDATRTIVRTQRDIQNIVWLPTDARVSGIDKDARFALDKWRDAPEIDGVAVVELRPPAAEPGEFYPTLSEWLALIR